MRSGPEHGGNVYGAARRTGRSLDRLVDFSASINPLGPSPKSLRAISDSLPRVVHYPDPDCVLLRNALARRWRVAPDRIVIGNGSSELITLIPLALPITRAVILGPTFAEYERAVLLAGGAVEFLHASRRDGYRPPIELLRGRLEEGRPIDALFLCNPNSPTGQALSVRSVRQVLEAAEKRKVWTVLDETFVEYCADRSVLPLLARYPHCLVLRSFTKFYALPGLRLGYLVGPAQVVARVKSRQPPWSVNVLAQAAALAALRDRRHATASRSFMVRERAVFARDLAALPGVTVFPSPANFLLVELPAGFIAKSVVRRLAKGGLLVRDCSNVPGLNGRTIRLAVRRPEQNRRLVRALKLALGGTRR
ncbi:MAG: threonine-phosphate decarboxylase CobD [Nitrospirota bacterium]